MQWNGCLRKKEEWKVASGEKGEDKTDILREPERTMCQGWKSRFNLIWVLILKKRT
jgi:hypothetical protein